MMEYIEVKKLSMPKGGNSMELSGIYDLLLTVALGIVTWCLKELYGKNEKRQQENKASIEKMEDTMNKHQKEMYKEFVTKEDHYRDINAIEQKIDGIKDILLEMKKDIGTLTGKTGREG